MDRESGRRLLQLALGGVAVRPSRIKVINPTTSQPAGVDLRSSSVGAVRSGQDESHRTFEDSGSAGMVTKSNVLNLNPTIIAEALALEATERDHLLNMAEAVGISPRRAQRFANLYRLLKASLSPTERRHFVSSEGEPGSYIGALVLLAAATGAPQAARWMTEKLKAQVDEDPGAYLASVVGLDRERVPLSERAAFDAIKSLIEGAMDKQTMAESLHLWSFGVRRFFFNPG